jgi:hypothetical protein
MLAHCLCNEKKNQAVVVSAHLRIDLYSCRDRHLNIKKLLATDVEGVTRLVYMETESGSTH